LEPISKIPIGENGMQSVRWRGEKRAALSFQGRINFFSVMRKRDITSFMNLWNHQIDHRRLKLFLAKMALYLKTYLVIRTYLKNRQDRDLLIF